MPTHAILGATGATGSAVLRTLLTEPASDLVIHILVRSKAKLLAIFPNLEDLSFKGRVRIFIGSNDNTKTLAACLNGASVIYVCIATNIATKTVDIARTTAEFVGAALSESRDQAGNAYVVPTVLINRSLSLNKDVKPPIPWPFFQFMKWIIWPVYSDLVDGCEVYASLKKQSLLDWVIIDGPALMDPDGVEPTGYKFMWSGTTSLLLSYADLGAAFVEIAHDPAEYQGKAVGVTATGKVKGSWMRSNFILFYGLWTRLWRF